MKCPSCNSSEVDQTDKFDETVIDQEECTHGFECHSCGCSFTITYHAFSTVIVEEGDIEDE